jgi:aerobic-type carbon monoxide dehydrogenase small subunit (CoxS/CutS family)
MLKVTTLFAEVRGHHIWVVHIKDTQAFMNDQIMVSGACDTAAGAHVAARRLVETLKKQLDDSIEEAMAVESGNFEAKNGGPEPLKAQTAISTSQKN